MFRSISAIGADSNNDWIRKSSHVPGWIMEDEHEFLWESAMHSPPGGHFVEIGSFRGKSACILAGAAITRGLGEKLYCIDPFDHVKALPPLTAGGEFRRFIENAEAQGIYEAIVPIATCSNIALPALALPVSFAFIDADHSETSVLEDFSLVEPKMIEGGRVVFHDAAPDGDWPGVARAVEQIVSRGRWRIAERRNTMASLVRR